MIQDRVSARPATNLPKGSAYGLLAVGMLPGVVPFLVMQSLVPVLHNGIDVWLGTIWPVMGASAVASTVMALGLLSRKLWYIWFIYVLGRLLLALFTIGLGLGLAVLIGLLPEVSPDLRFMSVVNIIDWLVVSPLAWVLLRTLRQRYWQPWTTPDQWEQPAPVPPARTLLMTWAQRKRGATLKRR